jgi:hypothetical protein
LDDLDCEQILAFLGNEFIASGEPSLPKEIALEVLCDRVGFEAIILDDAEVLMR